MYVRNIKFGALLTEAHMKTLDNYVKGHMKIEEGYELVQDIPNPYIFIRVKGSPKKINTGLTMESLQHYTLSDSINEEYMKGFPDIKTYEDEIYGITLDFSEKGAVNALNSGRIVVCSSYTIKNGTFVTPSKMESMSYASSDKVYSKANMLKLM